MTKKRYGKWIAELVVVLAIGFVLSVLLQRYVICLDRASGTSMEPTVHDGSFVIEVKAGYTPARNDIVIVRDEVDDILLIKRIVGLPGETIYLDWQGAILIDGRLYNNAFGNAYRIGSQYVGREVTLGEDEYFLLGDNRAVSRDSRDLGSFTRDEIEGHVVWIADGEEDPYAE